LTFGGLLSWNGAGSCPYIYIGAALYIITASSTGTWGTGYWLLIRPLIKGGDKEQEKRKYPPSTKQVEESKRYVGGCNRKTVSSVSERKINNTEKLR
jgi:hypothetical protein